MLLETKAWALGSSLLSGWHHFQPISTDKHENICMHYACVPLQVYSYLCVVIQSHVSNSKPFPCGSCYPLSPCSFLSLTPTVGTCLSPTPPIYLFVQFRIYVQWFQNSYPCPCEEQLCQAEEGLLHGPRSSLRASSRLPNHLSQPFFGLTQTRELMSYNKYSGIILPLSTFDSPT